jgi:hypothetical protein
MAPGDELPRPHLDRLLPLLQEMEECRRRKVRQLTRLMATAAGLLIAGLAAAACARSPILIPLAVALPLLVAVVGGAVVLHGFVPEFKRRVVRAVVESVDPALEYSPTGHVTEDQFRASGIFRQSVDRFGGEDHVRGHVGATRIEFSEVHAEYRTTRTDSKGRTHTDWHTIFRGLFLIADFNKHLRGRTLVLPDVAEATLGWLGQGLQGLTALFAAGDLVKLEDPEFEKKFVVYADDQVEARYVLSPSLMQRITAFARTAGRPCYFSFAGANVYVAVSTSHDMFEPRLWTTLMDPGLIAGYLADLRFALGVVEDLDLNTRIWTKE